MERYRVVNPPIISECVDGEVIVINLDAGTYYSLRGAAGFAWERLRLGASVDAVVAALQRRYEASSGEVEEALRRLVDELVANGLLHPATDEAPVSADLDVAPEYDRIPFDGCALERFDDMQELLAMDPIHEVDDAGWPSAAGEESEH